MPYLRARLSHSNAEALTPLLFELKATGIEVLDESLIEAYFGFESIDQIESLRASLLASPLQLEELIVEEDRNWTAMCSELMSPIKIRSLEIHPLESNSQPPPYIANKLYIIPGSGFGTGHHPTTSMILELLQSDLVKEFSPERLVDVGTGSAILAIAAQKLFAKPILALDIDPDALINARENIELNRLSTEITLQHGTLLQDGPVFDCILANLYLQVLIELEPVISKRLEPSCGLLIVSGVQEDQWTEFQAVYSSRWQIVHSQNRDGWVCAGLRRAE